MISMDKKYVTRSGEPVRILCTDNVGPYPIVGTIDGRPESWSVDGENVFGEPSSDDLIDAPREIHVLCKDGIPLVINHNDQPVDGYDLVKFKEVV